MKGWTRKHHGYQPRTSPMHQNFAKCSTSNTQISWDCRIANRSWNGHCTTVQQTYHKFFLFFLLYFILFLFIPKCSCSLPIYLLSLSGPPFLSSLSIYSFISFIIVFLSSPTILHFLIILLSTLRTPLVIICITLTILVAFPQSTLCICPLLSLPHRPTPTCPPMC